MKTTLDLPEELVREIKLRAVLQRRPFKAVAADILRQGLGMAPIDPEPPKLSTKLQWDEYGLPTIRCSKSAPASAMTVEALLALEQSALQTV